MTHIDSWSMTRQIRPAVYFTKADELNLRV